MGKLSSILWNVSELQLLSCFNKRQGQAGLQNQAQDFLNAVERRSGVCQGAVKSGRVTGSGYSAVPRKAKANR